MMPSYRQIEIESSNGPPEPEEISKVETLLGTSLPGDFLEFLQVANGGYYEFCIKIPPDNEEVSFGDVYVVGRDESGHYGAGTFLYEIDNARVGRKLLMLYYHSHVMAAVQKSSLI
jgi:hypothetical protein